MKTGPTILHGFLKTNQRNLKNTFNTTMRSLVELQRRSNLIRINNLIQIVMSQCRRRSKDFRNQVLHQRLLRKTNLLWIY